MSCLVLLHGIKTQQTGRLIFVFCGLSGGSFGAMACNAESKRRRGMIENVALMAGLMFLGVGVTVALLVGFIYYLEIQSDNN